MGSKKRDEIKRSEIKTEYKVIIIESERGWGSKIDEVIYFETADDAADYADIYNKTYNNKDYVPDWYMYAEVG